MSIPENSLPLEVLQESRVLDYISVAVAIIYACDYLETFEDEVSLIWSEKWGLGKVLFVITRYTCWWFLLFLSGFSVSRESPPSLKICEGLNAIGNIVQLTVAYSSTATLLLCLYALLGAKKRYLYILTGAYIIFLATSLTLMGNYVHLTKTVSPTLWDNFPYVCAWIPTQQASTYTTIAQWVLLSRESLLFLLSGVAMFKQHRRSKGPLTQVLLYNGGFYYLAICAMGFANAIFNTPGVSTDMYGFAAAFMHAAKPILSNRLLINIRKAGMGKDKDREAISTLVFATIPVHVQSVTVHSAGSEITSSEGLTVIGEGAETVRGSEKGKSREITA